MRGFLKSSGRGSYRARLGRWQRARAALAKARASYQRAIGAAEGDFAEPHLVAVPDPARHQSIVRAERKTARGARGLEYLLPCVHIPKPQDTTPISARQAIAGMIESNLVAPVLMPLQHPTHSAGRDITKVDLEVTADHGQCLAIRMPTELARCTRHGDFCLYFS